MSVTNLSRERARRTGYKAWPPVEAAKYEDRIIIALPNDIGYVKQFIMWDDIEENWQIATTSIPLKNDEKWLSANAFWHYDILPDPDGGIFTKNATAEKSKTAKSGGNVVSIAKGRPAKKIPAKTAEKVKSLFLDGKSKAAITRDLGISRYTVDKVLKAA